MLKVYQFLFVCMMLISCREGIEDRSENTIDYFLKELQKDSIAFNDWQKLGDLYVEKGIVDKAVNAYESVLEKDSLNTELILSLSDLYFKQLKFNRAFQLYTHVLKLDSNSQKAYLKLAEINIYSGNYNRAFYNINKLLKIDVSNPNAYFLKGICYKQLKDTVNCISSYRTAVDLNPNYYDAYLELGLICTLRNNIDGLMYYKNALEVDSNNLEAIYGLAWSYDHFNNYSEAKALYNKILNTYPNDVKSKYNLALIYLKEMNFESSIKIFLEIQNDQSVKRDVNYNLSRCYRQLGQVKLADSYLTKALMK